MSLTARQQQKVSRLRGTVQTFNALSATEFAEEARKTRGKFSGTRYAGAEIGISQDEMQALGDAMMAKRDFETGRISKADFKQKKMDLLPRLNALDARAKTFQRKGLNCNHRPMAYVPYFDNTAVGSLIFPNEGVIIYRYGRGKSTGHPLLELFGQRHNKMIGWVTRDRVQSGTTKGKILWDSPLRMYKGGATNARRGIHTKAVGSYVSAGGKQVWITAATTGRLPQMIANNQVPGIAFTPNPNFDRSSSGFRCPHPLGNSPLQPGERVVIVRGTVSKGQCAGASTARYAIVKESGSSGTKKVGLELTQAQINARDRADRKRAEKRGGPPRKVMKSADQMRAMRIRCAPGGIQGGDAAAAGAVVPFGAPGGNF